MIATLLAHRKRRSNGRVPCVSVCLILLLAAVLCPSAPVRAQENETCLMCHAEVSVFEGMPRAEQLHIRPEEFSASVHGASGMLCVDCHQGLAGREDFPHPTSLARVECGICHTGEAEQHSQSLHGQAAARGDPLAPACSDCHGTHDIQRHTDSTARTNVINVPLLCGECHHEGTDVSRLRDIPKDRILENYSLSIHGAGLFRQGLTVTAVCTSCHTAHFTLPHTDQRSSISRENIVQTCMTCHAQIEQVHRKVIEGKLWETEPQKIPVCVDCHAPHRIRNNFYSAGAANRDCLVCHDKPDIATDRGGERISLYVDESVYATSAHAGVACARCHSDVTTSRLRACETISRPVDCSVCHPEPVAQYQESMHGRRVAQHFPDAPTCQDCHPKHAELSRQLPPSPTFPRNIPDLCGKCHREGEPAAVRARSELGNIVNSYRMSIHGKGLLKSGLLVTATCTNCHTAHGELPASDPRSTVSREKVSDTCGTCHNGIEEEFKKSVHWPGNARVPEGEQLPTCKDCHSSHTISRTDETNFRIRMMDQCGRCHEAEAETFFETYHGKVSRLGAERAAKCYDCHGTHNIHAITDPASTLSRRNIVATCSQCHTGANIRFTGYLTHATHHDPRKYPFLFIAFWAMTALLVGTLTVAFLHTLAWLFRLWRSREEWRSVKEAREGLLYRRFTTFQRGLHGTMLLSFMLLALTGMALKFSYMGWAQVVARVLGGFGAMGILHRIGAVTLIGVFLIHLRDVLRQKRESGTGWMEFIFARHTMMFTRSDLREFVASIKWFFGRGPRPHYGRFTYWEKFDYFAVFWGMFIIGSTGLFLWFPEFFTLILPGSWVNVATIIHSDEALLAVGFIFTVHFFNTHFRLDKFPMDPVIFTGRVSLEELKHDKPREYEELVAEGRLEEQLVEPYHPKVERGLRIFGFAALGVGLTIIFLIIYTMLFGYQ